MATATHESTRAQALRGLFTGGSVTNLGNNMFVVAARSGL